MNWLLDKTTTQWTDWLQLGLSANHLVVQFFYSWHPALTRHAQSTLAITGIGQLVRKSTHHVTIWLLSRKSDLELALHCVWWLWIRVYNTVTGQFADKTTRDQSSRRLVNSRISQLAETFSAKFEKLLQNVIFTDSLSASWPVRELSSTRVV